LEPENNITIRALYFPLLAILLGSFAGCGQRPNSNPSPQQTMPKKDINEVLRSHDQEIMAIPGVVGIYVGLLDDEKTPCLKVMVVKKTLELERKIPRKLEGYPVVIEETGEIHPMKKN
jgi:hypothetical protein